MPFFTSYYAMQIMNKYCVNFVLYHFESKDDFDSSKYYD